MSLTSLFQLFKVFIYGSRLKIVSYFCHVLNLLLFWVKCYISPLLREQSRGFKSHFDPKILRLVLILVFQLLKYLFFGSSTFKFIPF